MENLMAFAGVLALCCGWLAVAQMPTTAPSVPPELAAARQKYLALGYGMFIHFNMSTYARADQQGEKIFKLEHETGKEDPKLFNPPSGKIDVESWAQLAKDAGMRYAILTVKHHGGFCLWDSQHTTHDVASSPYGKDVVRQFVDACRARGLRVGLYYSPLDRNRTADLAYTQAQIEELLTRYGPIDALWLDQFGWPRDIQRSDLRDHIRKLQPLCLFDSNGGADPALGDVVNIERVGRQKPPAEPFDLARDHFPNARGKPRPLPGQDTEICETLRGDGGWFYHTHGNDDLKSDDHVLTTLQRQLQGGGSFLVNVTPDGDGRIPQQQVDLLLRIAPQAKAMLAADPPGRVVPAAK